MKNFLQMMWADRRMVAGLFVFYLVGYTLIFWIAGLLS